MKAILAALALIAVASGHVTVPISAGCGFGYSEGGQVDVKNWTITYDDGDVAFQIDPAAATWTNDVFIRGYKVPECLEGAAIKILEFIY